MPHRGGDEQEVSMSAHTTGTSQASTARVLYSAARQALRAPSVFNSQPWRWRVRHGALELLFDGTRQLAATDPDRRLLIISCGAALHHARVALAAAGWAATVERKPDPEQAELLARIRVTGTIARDPEVGRMAAAIPRRRTDRRAFGDRPVPQDEVNRLRHVVEREGVHLHVVRWDQLPMLAISTGQAAAAELDDRAYRDELAHWTSRPEGSGDGVPPETAVQPAPRRVPVRDHVPGGTAGLTPGEDFDRGAVFVVLFGDEDEPGWWLRAGEALSALLLTATADGLATAPLSDAIEVSWPRHLLRGLLSGIGQPYLVVRLGYGPSEDLPPAPRREPPEVIEFTSG
jgi:nitroreductase